MLDWRHFVNLTLFPNYLPEHLGGRDILPVLIIHESVLDPSGNKTSGNAFRLSTTAKCRKATKRTCINSLTSGLVGSISLLITSITGPGIVILPLMFQQAGWVMPVFIFILIGFLAGLASLLIIESITLFPNNHNLETNVEFTVLVHQFYGRKIYYLFLFILYGSLQSTNIASIIGSAQIFDSVFVGLFGGTCGYGLYPINGLYCVYQVSNSNSPFDDNYMLTTLGYLVELKLTRL